MNRPPGSGSEYYQGSAGDRYFFEYQDPQARAGAFLNVPLYRQFVGPQDTVVDFGCGGGYLLASLSARRKIGIDVNPQALERARANGLETFNSTEAVSSNLADVVISNHGLEHTLRPFDVLVDLGRITRPGGLLVLYLPADNWLHQRRYHLRDVNHHLYTWTPLLLGNLLKEAGWSVQSASLVFYAWPPRYFQLLRFVPARLAQWICRVSGLLLLQPQIHAIARKPV